MRFFLILLLYKKQANDSGSSFLHTREIFRVLDLMQVDVANFTIDRLRPVLQVQSVEYERAQFQSIVDKTPSE